MDPTRYVIQFDSASAMLYALGACLQDEPYGGRMGISQLPPFTGRLLNLLPKGVRRRIYTGGGWLEALPPASLSEVRGEEISQWVVDQYPARTFPAMMIGSSTGAALHLSALLGLPWLPQTVLIAARRRMDPDEMLKDLAWGRAHVGRLLAHNPDFFAHQMHDPMQDRLMVSRMAYFRMKRAALGSVYRRFITAHLAAGGTLYTVECRYRWPVRRVSPRYVFQVGGLGGIPAQEYLQGSRRVSGFLRRQGSTRTRWALPEPNEDAPEAEWGFLPPLLADIRALARRRGYRVRRLIFDHPEDISAPAADFSEWWYQQHGQPVQRRLLAQCFCIVEPWWALRCRCTPFWLAFNAEPSAQVLERFLNARRPYDEVYMTLMSNGVESIGLASAARWASLVQRARRRGTLLGVNQSKYPMDFGTYVTYDNDLRESLQGVMREPLPLARPEDFDGFLRDRRDAYPAPVEPATKASAGPPSFWWRPYGASVGLVMVKPLPPVAYKPVPVSVVTDCFSVRNA